MSIVDRATFGQVQQGGFKFDLEKSLSASMWKYWRNCVHLHKPCNWIR